jgi:hypothetical protein
MRRTEDEVDHLERASTSAHGLFQNSPSIRFPHGRTAPSVANGVLPETSSRTRITDEGQRRYKFKISDPINSEKRPSLAEIRRYLKSVNSSHHKFFSRASIAPLASALLNANAENWIQTKHFARWLNTESVNFSTVATAETQTVKVGKGKRARTENAGSTSTNVPARQMESVPIFQSKAIDFNVDTSDTKTFESVQVVDLYEEATTSATDQDFFATKDKLTMIKEAKRIRERGQVLFCGGPLSALRTCPRKTCRGEELFAVATFLDEKHLIARGCDVSYVQFWTIPSDLK